MCQLRWSSGHWEMGGLDRHCPGWDAEMCALCVKALLQHVNSQSLEELLGKKAV